MHRMFVSILRCARLAEHSIKSLYMEATSEWVSQLALLQLGVVMIKDRTLLEKMYHVMSITGALRAAAQRLQVPEGQRLKA